MYNFAIVDDKKYFLDKIEKLIENFNNEFNHKGMIYKFQEYDTSFHELMHKNLENMIYILDIETENGDGLDEAEDIHDLYPESKVILISMYQNKYTARMLRNPHFYIGFVSKEQNSEDFKKELYELLKRAINFYNKEKSITIKKRDEIIKIYTKDVTFIEASNRHTIINRLNKNPIKTNFTLKKYEEMNFANFKKTHNSCIINFDNVSSFNSKKSQITFKDETTTDLVSRTYKKDINKYIEASSFKKTPEQEYANT